MRNVQGNMSGDWVDELRETSGKSSDRGLDVAAGLDVTAVLVIGTASLGLGGFSLISLLSLIGLG